MTTFAHESQPRHGPAPGTVFPSRVGTPMEPENLDRSWRRIRATAGLDWLRLHDLRHACATFLLASGATSRTVMKVLGHSQIGLTMNTYAHVLPEIERAPLLMTPRGTCSADWLYGP